MIEPSMISGLDLNPIEVRVLGALLEKDMTTPEYYPLSLNALVNACNQKTNRDPIAAYDEVTVREAIVGLRDRGLARPARGDSRVTKYEHSIGEAYNFGRGEMAVICVMLLRGAQTLNEIRDRTHRMHEFQDMDSLESCIRRLGEREPPLTRKLAKQPGWKEVRYTHLFGDTEIAAAPPDTPALEDDGRIERLEREVAELRRAFEEFRAKFE